ncbi:hypothetical protein CBP51_13950 [Cellvibrio mixtus]|uniref:Uncharacterized protein n=1 Tax=Cellvibrio mixtus TaxID=39650 RepID=A0A266Q367_9GAMM|nr:hypothetical protein [Cellvibrio mixtus]OZY84313.1 hypothetical protein CBP51_13950 [Cellvibrio mixtus]
MKITLSIFLALMSKAVFGLSLDTTIKTLTPESLFQTADIVVITNIESGSYHEKSFTFSLRGNVLLGVKGKPKGKIEFSDSGLWGNASKLNGIYLVFLQNTDSHLKRVNSSQSVIELNRIEEVDIPNLEGFLKEIGAHNNATFSLGGNLWVVSSCVKKNDNLCKEFSETFQFTMKMYGK